MRLYYQALFFVTSEVKGLLHRMMDWFHVSYMATGVSISSVFPEGRPYLSMFKGPRFCSHC